MTQLATRNGADSRPRPPAAMSAGGLAHVHTIDEMWDMACWIVKGNLFPEVKTPETAISLMLLCQADGMHPVHALRRYHVMFGRFSMKADSIQAEAQARGMRIEVVERSARRAAALFSHPSLQPKPVELEYTMQDAVTAGDAKKNPLYTSRPAAMLWARLVSMAVTTIDPGTKLGTPSSEELEDTGPGGMAAIEVTHTVMHAEAAAAVAAAQVPVLGYHGTGPDGRQYREVVADGVAALNDAVKAEWSAAFGSDRGAPKTFLAPDAHLHLMNRAVQLGRVADLPAAKTEQFNALKRLYAADPDWVRTEVQAYLEGRLGAARDLIAGRRQAAAAASPDVLAAADVDPDEDGQLGQSE